MTNTFRGTNPQRHPWFSMARRALVEALRNKRAGELVEHVQVTPNYGILGGWLTCRFWTAQGMPTGITESTWASHPS